jgi:broad specificity phosphatase PhoE
VSADSLKLNNRMTTTHIIAVRHGETVWNRDGRLMGNLDIPLNENGLRQAEAVAERLARIAFTIVYSSDLSRAYDTARVIADRTGKDIIRDPRLRERNAGILQGLTKAERSEKHADIYRMQEETGVEYVIPEGESDAQMTRRVVDCLEEIRTNHIGGTVVLVAHGGVLARIVQYTLGLSHAQRRHVRAHNACICEFIHDSDRWILETWNDTGHLEVKDESAVLEVD